MDRRNFIINAGAALTTLTALHNAKALTSLGKENVSTDVPLLFGTDYYPDQTPEHLWEEDAIRMADMGITNIRIAEFAWALMEPQEGHFDFAWLDRSIKILNAHKIAVILGTPSAAPPNWLTQKYPEVLEVNDHGMTLATGTRRFTCPTNKTYRRLSLIIATQMAKTYASTPGIVGWQIDNELTLGESARCFCRFCREGFQHWLQDKYKTLDAMNGVWGTVFWSNTYTDFNQVPVPLPGGAPPNPGLALDYDRYQSYANVSFLEEQLTVLRRLCPNHFITTNNVGSVDTIDQRDLYRNLDFVSSDNYPGFFGIYLNGPDSGVSAPPELLAPFVSFTHDFSRGMKDGKSFLIMEEQSGKAGQTIMSPQPEPGQLRLWTYQAVAHGAMGINYFRWDTATSGAEEYWHGIIQHDRTPSPGFDEMKRTMAELKTLGREALNAPSVSEIALCYDYNADWALAIQPGQPKLKYQGEAVTWYGCLSASHTGVDIVDATRDLSAYKILCAPAMYIVTPQQADRIRTYVQNGGLFIAGVRLGVKDEHSRIVQTPLPGLLREVMGVDLLDYQPIYSEKQGVRFSGLLAGSEADCHVWSDIIDPKQTEVLATYTTASHAGKAAITSNTFGKGKAIYVGAHLDPADLARVLLTLAASSGISSPIQAKPGVEVTTRRSARGPLTYLLNHTATAQTVQIPGSHKDVIDNSTHSNSISLDPYGVRVLQPA